MKYQVTGKAMGKPSRVLNVGLGCVGLIVVACGVGLWRSDDLADATDPVPFYVAETLILLGCVIIFQAGAQWWRR